PAIPVEESIAVKDPGLLLAVFDGMGGAASGDVASSTAAELVARQLPKRAAKEPMAEALLAVVHEANDEVQRVAEEDPRRYGMGTTVTAGVVCGHDLFVAHVGDSRLYLLRSDELTQITEDQSLSNELVAQGQLSVEDAAHFEYTNVILQALGVTEDLRPFVGRFELRRGDRLLLCSDGLTDMIEREKLVELMGREALSEVPRALVAAAKEGGGHDNITALVAEIGGDGLEPPTDAKVDVEVIQAATSDLSWRRRARMQQIALLVGLMLLAVALAALIVALGTL
ncbi:MAG: serine/threonine-protein phosphatase, partial [Myxococcales bacterium]|nr:serine/threonine-protein phosphatase [Myxococcales bacterium]